MSMARVRVRTALVALVAAATLAGCLPGSPYWAAEPDPDAVFDEDAPRTTYQSSYEFGMEVTVPGYWSPGTEAASRKGPGRRYIATWAVAPQGPLEHSAGAASVFRHEGDLWEGPEEAALGLLGEYTGGREYTLMGGPTAITSPDAQGLHVTGKDDGDLGSGDSLTIAVLAHEEFYYVFVLRLFSDSDERIARDFLRAVESTRLGVDIPPPPMIEPEHGATAQGTRAGVPGLAPSPSPSPESG